MQMDLSPEKCQRSLCIQEIAGQPGKDELSRIYAAVAPQIVGNWAFK